MNVLGGTEKQIQTLLQKRDFAKAEELIGKLLEQNPQDPDAYFFSGTSQYLQGDIKKTIELLTRALQLNPKHTDAAICLSVLYNDIGRYDEAKRIFERANQSILGHADTDELGINKKFAVKHLELADLYMRYRRTEEAIEEYTKAICLDPHNPALGVRRAKAFSKKGFVTRAIQELQIIKRDHPRFFEASVQLGMLHYGQGNILEAELEWESILALDPKHRSAQACLEMAQKDRLVSGAESRRL